MNNKYKTTIFIFLEIVFLALLAQVVLKNPIKESLACQKSTYSTTVDCSRTLGYFFNEEKFDYSIIDVKTVKLEDQVDAREDYITLDFFIGATLDTGKKVVLLSVPEQNTSYATELVKKIQQIPQSQNTDVSFERNQIPRVLIFVSILLLLVILTCYKYFKK